MPGEFTNPAYIDPGLASDVSLFLGTAGADATAKVAAEVVARIAADAALTASITAKVATEATARAAGDGALDAAITAEAAARTAADSAFTTQIIDRVANEATARTAGDAALDAAITAGAAARVIAIASLNNSLANQIAEASDTALAIANVAAAATAAEAAARAIADSGLYNYIDTKLATVESTRSAWDGNLDSMITTETDARQTADESLSLAIAAETAARIAAVAVIVPSPALLMTRTTKPTQGLGQALEISGTLTSNGTTPAVFPILRRAGMLNGKAFYSNTGFVAKLFGDTSHTLGWDSANSRWVLLQLTPSAFWYSYDAEATPDSATTWVAQGAATGGVDVFEDSSEESGTVGVLGQVAIIQTTNASGTFLDIWTCCRESPVFWQPPGQITRAPNGVYWRAIVANGGAQTTQQAYP